MKRAEAQMRLPKSGTIVRSQVIASALALVALAACTPVNTAPAPTREIDVFADVPQVVPAAQTAEMQRQGGVTITVAPTHFDTLGRTACVYRLPQAGLANLLVTPPTGATQ